MNNLLVRDVKYLDEQYRIGEGTISDGAFKPVSYTHLRAHET